MLIDSLRISAFRGIATELPLDLTARLTLLHAPNGTGKTSICDAVQWVLTGGVHRLSAALRESATDGLRNIFATERQTWVEANLTFDDASLQVRRLGVGREAQLQEAAPSWRRLGAEQAARATHASESYGE